MRAPFSPEIFPRESTKPTGMRRTFIGGSGEILRWLVFDFNIYLHPFILCPEIQLIPDFRLRFLMIPEVVQIDYFPAIQFKGNVNSPLVYREVDMLYFVPSIEIEII